MLATAATVALMAASQPVGVGLDEYELALGRRRVLSGAVRFNVTNSGEDIHDLAVRYRGRTIAATPEVFPGGRFVLRARLRANRTYTLVCTIGDHAERGMKARLAVRPRT
jgi:hypothetical protein